MDFIKSILSAIGNAIQSLFSWIGGFFHHDSTPDPSAVQPPADSSAQQSQAAAPAPEPTYVMASPGLRVHSAEHSLFLQDDNGSFVTDPDGRKVYDPSKVQQVMGNDWYNQAMSTGSLDPNQQAAGMAHYVTDALTHMPETRPMIGADFESSLQETISRKLQGDPELAGKSMGDIVASVMGSSSTTMLAAGRDHPGYLKERLLKDYHIDLDRGVEQSILTQRWNDNAYGMATEANRLGLVIDKGAQGGLGELSTPVLPSRLASAADKKKPQQST